MCLSSLWLDEKDAGDPHLLAALVDFLQVASIGDANQNVEAVADSVTKTAD